MVKQVIVVRKDLNMRKGKIAAQAAHASLKVFLDRKKTCDGFLVVPLDSAMSEWVNGIFTKVVVCVDSEAELLEVYRKAGDAGLPSSLVRDAGHTEFHGVPTYTTVAIGPADADAIDAITGGLRLL